MIQGIHLLVDAFCVIQGTSGTSITGLQVNEREPLLQVPAPNDDEEEEGSASKRAKGSGGAVVGRWQEQPSRSASHKELRAAAAAAGAKSGEAKSGDMSPASGGGSAAPKQARKQKDPNIVEVLRFMKYFHLVPAQVRSF